MNSGTKPKWQRVKGYRKRMKRLVALALPFLATPALAWIDAGHMIVAAIAENDLKPEVKAKVDALLKVGGDERTRSFWTSACWADDFKTREDGPWHYINIHFREDGKPVDNKPLEENVVWAINRLSAVLQDAAKPERERADALRFLVHFVGDVHCPVHAVARDTDEFPRGDRGANDFKIVPDKSWPIQAKNLHLFWDMAGGLFGNVERPLAQTGTDLIGGLAKGIAKEFPRTFFPHAAEVSAQKWADESFDLAKTVAYHLKPSETPSTTYVERTKLVSKQRLALAGYRLADLLNRTLN